MLESPVSWSEVTTAVGTGGEPVQVLQLTPSALSRPSVGPQVSPGLHLPLQPLSTPHSTSSAVGPSWWWRSLSRTGYVWAPPSPPWFPVV